MKEGKKERRKEGSKDGMFLIFVVDDIGFHSFALEVQ